MKITFVYPRFEKFLSNNPELDSSLIDYFLADFTTPPSLGIPIMAAWTPPDVETELIDDNSGDPLDYSAATDLVAISCFTPQASRAFEIADGYRAHGTKVIMGGFFPSMMPDECLAHADSVNIGEVEPTWLTILQDAKGGSLKPKYFGGCRFDVSKLRLPKREIFYSNETYDWDEDLVQVTRGCSYNCAMCSIPAHMGSRIRLRPVEQVVAEVKGLKFENVYLADDTVFFPQKRLIDYSSELFRALAPLGKKLFVNTTLALRTDDAMLDLIAKSGVRNFYCTMNVDPASIRALQGGRKEQQLLIDLVKRLADREVRFFGSFAIGREWDDTGIADRVLELYTRANIRTSEFFLFTPYPGSVLWDRLDRQGRIFDKDWSHYNGAHVVAKHPTMSVEELHGQFIKVWNEFFKLQKHEHAAYLEPSTYRSGERVVGKPLRRRGVPGQAVVTGIGVLSPIGNDAASVVDALRSGRHGLAPITLFDTTNFRSDLGAEVRGFDAGEHLSVQELDTYRDRYLRYAIAASRMAAKDAGVELSAGNGLRRDVALVVATCNGGLLSAEEEYRWKHGLSQEAFDEKTNMQAQLYGMGKALAAALGIGGETWVVTTACSSSTLALGLAQTLINRGYYKTVIVGASDSLCVANMSGFDAIKATSTGQTAPFSLPEGLNIGESACFWVVEEMESAILRSARCLGRLAGHATTCDAYHPTAPDPRGDGAYRTLRAALLNSGLKLGDIGCINAHGTGTPANDRAECKGINRLLDKAPIPTISLKSFFGHCMGTAGILEATCNLLAMNAGFIPPTVNFTEPRPGCDIDCVPNRSRASDYGAFLSANYAFGGNNAAVVVTRWDHSSVPPTRKDAERVVITGIGAICSLGRDVRQTLRELRRGTVGLCGTESLGVLPNVRSRLAGLVPPFRAGGIDRRLDFTGMNKLSMMATVASKQALDRSGMRVGRTNAEEIGIAMGVCNGPPESDHMDSVFSSGNYSANIPCFSNVTSNSTAGWVSHALRIKGVNATLSPGPHAGLQSMAYAYDVLCDNRVPVMLAGAADEVYGQSYSNYDLIDYLYRDQEELDYRIRLGYAKRKVVGEGAACISMETASSAAARGATVLAEMLGYGMSMDGVQFLAQGLGPEGLLHALEQARDRADVPLEEIDLIVWAPQGNAQDKKVLDALERFLQPGRTIPLVTTTLNTGFVESASILITLAAAIEAISEGEACWPQRTGLAELDGSSVRSKPRHVLACGSTDLGYNFAVILRNCIRT